MHNMQMFNVPLLKDIEKRKQQVLEAVKAMMQIKAIYLFQTARSYCLICLKVVHAIKYM